jgi:hypothetical protein
MARASEAHRGGLEGALGKAKENKEVDWMPDATARPFEVAAGCLTLKKVGIIFNTTTF